METSTRKPKDLYRSLSMVTSHNPTTDQRDEQISEAFYTGRLNFTEAEIDWYMNLTTAALTAGIRRARK